MLIIYANGVLLCARDAQRERRELPTKHSALAISSFSANLSHEQGAVQPIRRFTFPWFTQYTLDSVWVKLRKDGIGKEVNHAPVITLRHE